MPNAPPGASPCARAVAHAARRLTLACAMLLAGASPLLARVDLPPSSPTAPVTISAPSAERWIQGEYEVWVLRGGCRIVQGDDTATSQEAVVWIARAEAPAFGPTLVISYLEGKAAVERRRDGNTTRLTDDSWLGDLTTTGAVTVQVPQITGAPESVPAIYRRGLARRTPEDDQAVRRTQFREYTIDPEMVPISASPPGTRRISVHPRSNVRPAYRWERDKSPLDGSADRWVAVINFGVNVIIEGVSKSGLIDISADRVVIWTVGPENLDLSSGSPQAQEVPLEIYMEGNIVFREGSSVIHADRMYYDVRNQVGMVLGAEMITPVPNYEGKLRLQSQLLRQMGEGRFLAQDSFITSSRLGVPSYRLQLGELVYEDNQQPVFDPAAGAPPFDPLGDGPAVAHDRRVSGSNGFLFLGDVPVFYWPTFSTNVEEPTFFIRRARLKNDDVFGTQVLTNWDGYQLLGRRRPAGDDWDISLDWLSKRGFGHGTTYSYQRDGFWILPGQTAGLFDYWGIQDHGHDNLGRGQRDLFLEKHYRWRLFHQHRQMLPYDWRLSTELGWISDRNFLNQYYEREWDELKDESTGLELKRAYDNISYSITADTRINSFFTQTEWYPRGDHYWLGQSLLGDALTWHEHTSIGYARNEILSYPENPAQQDTFRYLPWENWIDGPKGERIVTTQEIDYPFQLGPVKTVPYALGQLAHWGQDYYHDDMQRAYWQAGLRASMPMSTVNPMAESELWNVHGLAHKVVFDLEFSVAESNRDLADLPLYDALDDDSIEAFRRRMPAVTYGTQLLPLDYIPYEFDPRSYAVRSGLASWVTSPSAEVVDDLMAMRMGMRNRWQTKRGMPGRRKIIDWMVLDTNAVWFPKESRDNFGQALGLVDYDFRWHVGDRFTVVSDGLFDFFDEGQQIVSVGGFLSRPPRGNFYMGMRFLEGPIKSRIVSLSYNYWMSPKWVSSFGTSFDVAGDGNIGQRFAITRIGESLLISAGFNVDASRGNVGAMLAVEPRFLPKHRLGQLDGVQIPVAGAHGLE
ncbi:MAG TPA: organic solvent tolerance protein OstA [Planctomycetaceae bacterium]|nr:organic solvent tolerance protein OstA [Planctomycetaceae bacterium]